MRIPDWLVDYMRDALDQSARKKEPLAISRGLSAAPRLPGSPNGGEAPRRAGGGRLRRAG